MEAFLRRAKDKVRPYYQVARAHVYNGSEAFLRRLRPAIEILPIERLGSLREQALLHGGLRHQGGISNCGLLPWGDGYLGIAKDTSFHFCAEAGIPAAPGTGPIRACLAAFELDRSFRIRSLRPVRLLRDGRDPVTETDLVEDARLLAHGGRIYVSLNAVPGNQHSRCEAWLGVYDPAAAQIALLPSPRPLGRGPEKNWILFSGGTRLHLQYRVNPRIVDELDPETGAIVTTHRSRILSAHSMVCFGPYFRGSAAPIPFDDDFLLGSAHGIELEPNCMDRHYFTHFFLCERRAPFRIRWITPRLKLGERPARIQYLIAVLPTESADAFLVSFGVNECDNVFARLERSALTASFRRAVG